MALAGLVPFLSSAAAQASTLLESFDDCANFDEPPCVDPAFYDYSHTGTGFFFVSENAALDGKSYNATDTSAVSAPVSNFNFGTAIGSDFCAGDLSLSFAFSMRQLPVTDVMDFNLDEGDSYYFSVRVEPDSDVVAVVRAKGQAEVEATLFQATVNTWYNITIDQMSCADGASTIGRFIAGHIGVPTTISSLAGAGGGPTATSNFKIETEGGTVGGTFMALLDNLQIDGFVAPALSPDATVSVTDLVGFDVDDFGSGIIARTNGGDNVSAYTDDLTLVASDETNCGFGDAVIAEPENLAYVDCGAIGPDPEGLMIRELSLSDFGSCPTLLDALGTTDCFIDFTPDDDEDDAGICSLTGDFDDEATIRAVKDLRNVRIDFTESTGGNAYVGVAYSTTAGGVGVFEYTVQSGCDDINEEPKGFGPSEPDSICTSIEDDGDVFLTASDSATTTKSFQWTKAFDTSGDNALDGTLSDSIPHAAIGNAIGVSCARDRLLAVTTAAAGNVKMFNRTSGAVMWTATSTNEATRGVGLSGDAQWAFWVDGSSVNMAYGNNGTVVATFALPSGTFKEWRVEYNAQKAWAATDDNIAVYTIAGNVSDVPVGCFGAHCFAPPPGEEPGPTGGLVGAGGPLDPAIIGDGIGVGPFGGGLFASGLLILATAIGTGGAASQINGRSGVSTTVIAYGVGVGAVVGFMLSWAFGWLSAGAVFVVVIILGAAIYFRMRSGRGG